MNVPVVPDPPAVSWSKRILGVMTVLFGFLAGSVPARNSDLWLHLSTGRALAESAGAISQEPFLFDTESIRYVNHAWLTDFLAFQVHRTLGERGLIIGKGMVFALLALVLVLSRPKDSSTFPVLIVLLALLAISPRMLLQPMAISYLLLATTLLILDRPRIRWLLPPLIALWANLDDWFLLGPMAVLGHYLAGCCQPQRLSPLLVLVCLLAMLATPFHVYGVQLPAECSWRVWTSDYADDPRFAGLFASPWRVNQFVNPDGFPLGSYAFLALIGFSLLALMVRPCRLLSPYSLFWFMTLACACWQVRLIPFFAITTVFVWNTIELRDRWIQPRLANIAIGIGALALCFFAWSGWLSGHHSRDRGVLWEISQDAALVATCAEIDALASEPLPPGITSRRIVDTHPDLAHYRSWFSRQRYRSDSRLSLLAGNVPASDLQAIRTWNLQQTEVFLVVYDPNAGRMQSLLQECLREQPTMYFDRIAGKAVILRSHQPRERLSRPQTDPPFRPAATGWMQSFSPRSQVATGEAFATLAWYESSAERMPDDKKSMGRSTRFPQQATDRARRAIATNPQDADAWLALARARLFQSRTTWEAYLRVPILLAVRQAEIAGALNRALNCDPRNLAAHEAQAAFFEENQIWDLAYEHLLRIDEIRQSTRRTERHQRLMQQLFNAENRYLVTTAKMSGDPLGKARVAVQLGLFRRAIDDVLLKSSADLYGIDGLKLLIELLLTTGRIEEARELLDRKEIKYNSEALGGIDIAINLEDGSTYTGRLSAYAWYLLLLESASSNRDKVAEIVRQMSDYLKKVEQAVAATMARDLAVRLTVELGRRAFAENLFAGSLAKLAREDQEQTIRRNRLRPLLREDLNILLDNPTPVLTDTALIPVRSNSQRLLELMRSP